MEIRLRYLPITDACEGMVLGAPLTITENGVRTYSLPAGHVLTETNLHQISIRHAEFVCVQQSDERTPEERENQRLAAEIRLKHIFRAASKDNPAMVRLYDSIFAYRSL